MPFEAECSLGLSFTQCINEYHMVLNIKSYQQTQMTIAMPRSRYDSMGRPQVGNVIATDLKKI